jgi:fatty acid desaturase
MTHRHTEHPENAQRRNKAARPHPAGHLLLPVAAIGILSLGLAAGLELLGLLARVNEGIARIVSRGGAEKFPKHLPDECVWLSAAVLAGGLAAAILGTPGPFRRVALWLSAVVLVAAWAPVLSLAAHAPDIAAPWIATLWSGVCAIIYTARHRMPVDGTHASSP